jgi:Mn-dependent DtxR family transcriptional regulator
VKTVTALQSQYLSFIYVYTRIHGTPPAESDLRSFFRVKASAVHQMILTLHRNGLISRRPGVARSLEVLVPPKDLPLLEFLLPPFETGS